MVMKSRLSRLMWTLASVGIFTSLWEAAYFLGLANPMLLPPPHIFLANWLSTGKYFALDTRLGNVQASTIILAVAETTLVTTARVVGGLVVAFMVSLAVGMLIQSFYIFRRLSMPLIQMLSTISPIAWLPVAVVLFGVGNAASIFMIFISIFFIMTLGTVAEIERVKPAFIDLARNAGANRLEITFFVILPAILPRMFNMLRINLFIAWMVVLIAEAVGVHSGIGQVIMVSRNTFNSQLSFLAMAVVGVLGFVMDRCLYGFQRRFLYWA